MNTPMFNKPITAIALLTMLSLCAIADVTVLVNATTTKAPTVYVDGAGSVRLTWKSGKTQTFTSDSYANFGGLSSISVVADHGWHIITFRIDGNLQNVLDDDVLSLINVDVRTNVSATFAENNGVDEVDTGSGVEAYPYPSVGLIFDKVLTSGSAYAYTIALGPPDAKGESWDISTTATFEQSVRVVVVLSINDLNGSDPSALRLLRTELELARADINGDGVIDGTDVSIVANSNPSVNGTDSSYDPKLDLNNDGTINSTDVNIVNNYIGESVWHDITLQVVVDTINNLVYVYGITDHFSIFGVH
jgi:hypothetical protein